jgi:hypothetical protein
MSIASPSKGGIFDAMAKKYPKPIFKPRELKKLFEDQWYVEAEWPDGTIEQSAGPFATDSEARDWITHKSQAWLDSKQA